MPVRYIVSNFIKLPIKAVRADNPLLCLLKGFIMTASNCSAHAVISFQPRPPCQQQRFLSVIGCLVVLRFHLPFVIVCLYMCVSYWGEEIKAAVGTLVTQRFGKCYFVFASGIVLLCSGVMKMVQLLAGLLLRFPMCGAALWYGGMLAIGDVGPENLALQHCPYRMPWLSEPTTKV